MAKQIEGVYERILACAKKEFLQMGIDELSVAPGMVLQVREAVRKAE